MLFTDEIVIRALVQGAITLPEALMVLDTSSDRAQGGKPQLSPTSTQQDADMNVVHNPQKLTDSNYRPCGQSNEYGNIWVDYEAKCGVCHRWTTQYGEAEFLDGTPICNTCADADA